MTANTRSDTRHESTVFTISQRIQAPTTTATNDQPHRANPATAKATFKIHHMLIGRKVNRCFDIFSVCFIISDLFFNRHAARSRRSYRVSGARQVHVQTTQGFREQIRSPEGKEEDFSRNRPAARTCLWREEHGNTFAHEIEHFIS